MARARPRYTIAKVKEAIVASHGLLTVAARMLRCDRSTVYAYVAKHPTLAEAVRDAREAHIDLAEAKLLKAVEAGAPWAVAMVLKTIGRTRGYVERQEVDTLGTGGGTNVRIYLPQKTTNLLSMGEADTAKAAPTTGAESGGEDGKT